MKNLTFKAAMLNDIRTTVNRQSTDGQSQRHYKQTPLSKRWKVLMTLVFLFTLSIGQMWGADHCTKTISTDGKTCTWNFYDDYSSYTAEAIVTKNDAGFENGLYIIAGSKSNCSLNSSKYLSVTGTNNDAYIYVPVPSNAVGTITFTYGGSASTRYTTLLDSEGAATTESVAPNGSGKSNFISLINANVTTETISGADGNKWAKLKVTGGEVKYRIISVTLTTGSYSSASAPTISAPTADQSATYTVGDEIAALSITASGTPTPTYQWYYNSSASTTGATSLGSSARSASYTPANDVASDLYYYCVATNSAGSATSHYFHVTVSASSAPTHAISYNEESLKGHSVSGYPTEYTEGVGIASFDDLADVTNFHFNGWSPASISASATTDVELTATWVDAYNVTFSYGAGGGTAPASFQKWQGAKFNLPGQGSMTAPSGKVFDGWKASGTKYAENAEYTMGNAAVEFVAQWKAVPQTIFHWRSNTETITTDAANGTTVGGTTTLRTTDSGKSWGNESATYDSSVANDMKGETSGKELKSGGNALYLELALTSGSFQEGDTIFVTGYNPWIFSTSTSFSNVDVADTIFTGSSKTDIKTGYQIINDEISASKIYVRRGIGSGSGIAAIKVIRPAERPISSTTITLSDVKVNNRSISSDSLTTLVSAKSLLLKDEFVTAPEIKFNEHKVITYSDELLPATKVTDKVHTVTATLVDGNWQAQATINAITYTVTAPKQSSAKVTYYDGTTKIGEETVGIGGSPAEYAAKQSKDFATFVAWYSNSDLAEEHKIANIAELVVNEATNVYGKWAPAYASSINIEQWVLDNGVANAPFRAKLTELNYKYATLNNLDSLNDDPSKPYRNYAYLGQKVNKTDSEISFLLKSGSTLNVRFGHIGTPLNVVIGSAVPVELTSAEYANDAPGDKKYTYTATEDVIVKFQTTGTSTCVFKQIMIDEEIQNVILPAIVTLDANGGTYADESVKYTGTALVIGDATPEDEYHVFAGWFDGDDQIDATAYVPTKNVTLQAHYAPKTYSITYMPNGATTSVEYIVDDDATVVLGCPAQFTAPANTKFDGWNTDPAGNGDAYAAGDAVTENLTLHAQWQSYFTITYMDGETELDTEDVLEGDAPIGIADPVKAMNIFQGWTLAGNDEVIDLATLTSSTTVYAKWEVIDACFYYLPTKPAEAVQLAVDALVPGANGGSMKVLGDKIFNSPYGLSFENSGTAAVLVTLDKNMEAATVIKANVVVNPKEDNARGLLLRNAANSATVQEWTFVPAQNPDTLEFTYTVQAGDGLAGTNQFCIKRSTNAWLISLMVSNCAPEQFTVTYKDGEATLGTEGVYENEHPTADGINTHKKGYEFQGWAETVDGAVVDLNDITITAAKNLFAQYTVKDCSPMGVKFSMAIDGSKITSDGYYPNTTPAVGDLAVYATVSGGLAQAVNTSTGTTKRFEVHAATETEDPYFKLASGTESHVRILLDCPLAENDTIKFAKDQKIGISFDSLRNDLVHVAKNDAYYIVPAAYSGKDSIHLWYDGSGVSFTKVEVIRPEIYAVSFNLMGHGSDIADITGVVKGSKIAAPTAPTDGDYAFAGWYKENTLSNAWDFDNDVVTANTILYAKWLDMTDATLKSLKYGATDIALQDGVYEYNVELPSYTTAVPALTAETSNPNASAVVADDAAFDESGNAQSTVTVTPQKVGADQQVYTVNFTHAAALPQVDVTETTVWDFTNGNAAASKINLNYVDVVLANVAGVKTENINAQALLVNANYISNAQLQAKTIMFRTTVPGQLTIRYGCTSGKGEGNERTLYINDLPTTSATYGTDMVEYKQIVPAGEVTIKAMYGETPTVDIMNYRYIEFKTADYTRNVSNNIGTLCVDHNVLAGGALGATFYQIASRNEQYNDKIDFEEVLPNEELKAGEPYIFQSTTGKIELFYGATVADAPVVVRGMIGSFANTTLDITEENKSDILYIAQNKLWNCEDLVDDDLEVVANRAYIVMSDVPTYAEAHSNSNSAPRRRVTLGKDAEQVVTGVENLNASEQPVKLLINGQIFILRGEKLFDVTGKLVK